MIDVNPPTSAPYVGARVRWHASSGTNFGRVVSIDEEGQTLAVQVEGSTFVRTINIVKATLLSAPYKGAS